MNEKSNLMECEALYHIFTFMNNKNLAITGLHTVTEEGKNIFYLSQSMLCEKQQGHI
jgi:hypothetical protein